MKLLDLKQSPIIVLLLSASISLVSLAQNEKNIWYFGNNAGVDFNSGVPVAITNGQINTFEGVASVSDSNGDLLFYTDGSRVWNANHNVMANGNGLNGNSSSTQSAVIMPAPQNQSLFYIFTVDEVGQPDGLQYSVVNMSLGGGLGAVTTKNVIMHIPTCEKIAVAPHCNGVDMWVMTRDVPPVMSGGPSTFRSFLVTSAGVITTPVVSIGSTVGIFSPGYLGQMKFSPDATKLAVCKYGTGNVLTGPVQPIEVYDFDRSTGTLSNVMIFQESAFSNGTMYGCEFSPDGTKLYVVNYIQDVYQIDLCAGTNADMVNSVLLIGNTNPHPGGSCQLGPDNRIYIAADGSGHLHSINDPNVTGAGCNFTYNSVFLAGRSSRLGLPNFDARFSMPIDTILNSTQLSCNTYEFEYIQPYTEVASRCTYVDQALDIPTYTWEFGDGSTAVNVLTPSHNYSATGTYTVLFIKQFSCYTDTLIETVVTTPCPLPIELLDFRATIVRDNQVVLEWETASEIDNDYFVVERSIDGDHFETVLKQDGAGSSSSVLHYRGNDFLPHSGLFYYRLKQVDFNNSYSYSEVRSVKYDGPLSVSLVPNPANDQVELMINSKKEETISVEVLDLRGGAVMSLHELLNSGQNKVLLDVSKLVSGVYLVRIVVGDKLLATKNLMKK